MAEPLPAPASPSPVPPSLGRPYREPEQLSLFGEPAPTPTQPVLRLIKGSKARAANDMPEEEAPDTVRGTG
jgi:hypothetical protein